jgi:cytochrome c-type biogenesis protein CcmH/NrfG
MKFKLLAGIGVFAVSVTVFAQGGGAAAAAGAANASKGPEMSSGMGKDANFNQVMSQQHGGMYFSGKVAVDGGSLPWDPIPVIVDCNGVVKYDTQTDAKGGFAIQNAGRITTASELAPQIGSKSVTAAQLVGCQIKASLPGFRSSALTITNGNLTDNPDMGTITLHIDEHASGYGVSPTTAAAPPDALKKFDKARSEAMSNNPDGAQHDLQKAVQIDPKFAEAWYQLGKLQQKTKPVDALASYEKAVAADPQFVPPYEPMAELAAIQKKWQEVADAADHYLKLDPVGTAQIWYYSAVGNFNLGNKDVAEQSAKKALALDPQHTQAPNTEQLLAVILASKGDLAEALDHLRNCLTYTPAGPNADLMKQQIAQLERAVVTQK